MKRQKGLWSCKGLDTSVNIPSFSEVINTNMAMKSFPDLHRRSISLNFLLSDKSKWRPSWVPCRNFSLFYSCFWRSKTIIYSIRTTDTFSWKSTIRSSSLHHRIFCNQNCVFNWLENSGETLLEVFFGKFSFF